MTIHEAAEDAVKVWRDKDREAWRRTLALATDTRPLWKALQRLGLALDAYAKDPVRRVEEDNLADPPMAEIVVRSDGGPWAVHNQPCAVCGQRRAVLDLSRGVFAPCWPCTELGWDLKQSRPRWWQRRFRSRVGVAE